MSSTSGRSSSALFLRLAACAALFLAACPSARAYYYEPPPAKAFSFFKFKITRWQSSGSAYFRTSFLTPTGMWIPPAGDIRAGSTLDFRGLDSAINLFSAEVRLLKGFSVDAEYGDSRFSGGTGFDHDWLHSPNRILYLYYGNTWVTPLHRDFSLSRSSLAGTTKLYSFNAYLRVYSSGRPKLMSASAYEHSIDLYAGYSWYGDSIRMTNGVQVLETDCFLPTPPAGPFPGLNSTYKLHWQGVRVGFREQTRLSKVLTMEGKLAYSPNMAYRGVGYWNLRPDLSNPSFLHRAKGTVMEFSAALQWKMSARLLLDAGYMGTFYTANNGTDRTYGSDGTQSEIRLDKVKNSRKGLLLALSLKY